MIQQATILKSHKLSMLNLNNHVFKFKAGIWQWPGSLDGGVRWHFITLDRKLSEQIRSVYTKGFVKVEAKIGQTLWHTSLFPHMINKKEKKIEYLLCINKKVQKAEGLYAGDDVKVTLVIK